MVECVQGRQEGGAKGANAQGPGYVRALPGPGYVRARPGSGLKNTDKETKN